MFLFCIPSFAQQNDDYYQTDEENQKESTWQDKFYTGGGLGLQFGTITMINISPILGYRLTPKVNVGVGVSYTYYRDNFVNYETNIIGYSAFTQYRIYQGLFFHGEFNRINYSLPPFGEKIGVNAFLVGGGYIIPTGGNSRFMLMGLWNVLPNTLYPYQNPIIRAGVNVGF